MSRSRQADGSLGARRYGSGELDLAVGGVGVAAVEESGVADGADGEAAAFVGDLVDQGGALIALDADEAEFDELVVVELFLEFFEELGGETGFADFDDGIERLAASAEEGFLRAGEWEVVHGEEE